MVMSLRMAAVTGYPSKCRLSLLKAAMLREMIKGCYIMRVVKIMVL
jgi:hypothetical protein